MIKIEHTLFSLPFVLSAALLAIKTQSDFNPMALLWMALCLLGARSAGMSLNRIFDAKIDAANPRTNDREIPAGKISKSSAWLFTAISIAIYIYAAAQLPRLCLYLSSIPLIWITAYPFFKRFSFLAHVFLGTTLAGATLGGWIAITGSVETLAPIYLALAVMFWVTGFDVIYSTMDIDFDIQQGLHSIPARFGKKAALQFARLCHLLTPVFLYLAGQALNLGLYYNLGIVAVIIALLFEQKLVKEEKIEAAFFTVNTWISVLILAFVLLEFFLGVSY